MEITEDTLPVRVKKGRVIRLRLGPLTDAAGPVIERRAAARGVGVQWEK